MIITSTLEFLSREKQKKDASTENAQVALREVKTDDRCKKLL